ncbi:hypothetical protein F5887DRAFT_1175048 [Amanita rubescens]|nr:hypothetical protein F5887DRAFT_1175048 [Amanita rubescens]
MCSHVNSLAIEGTCTGEHSVGIGKEKTSSRNGMVHQGIDPLGLFNPGKLYLDDPDNSVRARVPPKAITRRAREDQSQQNHVGDCRGDSLLVDELRPYKHRSRQLDSIRSVRRYLVLERRITALYCAGARIAQSAEEAGVGEKAEKNETERERASCQANTKRNQKLFDQRTRIDIECNRATEELHIATGRIEQLRNECGVQSRLVEENKTLALERAHLFDLMTNVQKIHNNLERAGENDRRRLESQLQTLESQTQDLRAQLVQERDTIWHIKQKEIKLKELRSHLDRNMQGLSKTRESLISAETSKNHLEERVSDLNRQIQGSEEKPAVYERRPATDCRISAAKIQVTSSN